MSINSFTWHDLAAGILMLALAGHFCAAHWRGPDRLTAVLFAGVLACVASACLISFFMDNLVPAGADARRFPVGRLTAQLLRGVYTIGLVSLPVQVHFVVWYCRSRGLLARKIAWVYALFLGLIPLVWLPFYAQTRVEPQADTSSWFCCVPWMPVVSTFSSVFTVLWLVVQVYTQILLWRFRRQEAAPVRLGLHASVVQLFLIIETGGVVLAALNGWLGFAGPDPHPVAALVAGVVLVLSAVLASRRKRRAAFRYRPLDAEGYARGMIAQAARGAAGGRRVPPGRV